MKSLPAENIHQRLTDLRNGTGKSQKEVAAELNMEASVLSRIERGETKSVSHEYLIKFAEYYNVSTDYLLCISDMKLRKNVELEQLGLSNKALLLLLQGQIDGKILSKMVEHKYFPVLLDTIEAYFSEIHNAGFATRNDIIDIGTTAIRDMINDNPEIRVEGFHDIRQLGAQKVTGTEADIEKIRSIVMTMLKDIKKDYESPKDDISSEELKNQITALKKDAYKQKKLKPKFNEESMAQLTMKTMLGKLDMDDYEKGLFQELMVHMMKRKR